MAKYLMLKHYRGAPASLNDIPMDQWTPQEFSAHIKYMADFAARLELTAASSGSARPATRAATSVSVPSTSRIDDMSCLCRCFS